MDDVRRPGGQAPSGARVAELVLQVDDLDTMTAFWAGALDQVPERPDSGGWAAFELATGLVLLLVPPPEWETGSGRLHLDLVAGGEDEDYVERLVGLGARVVGTAGRDSVVLTDPEGSALVVHRR